MAQPKTEFEEFLARSAAEKKGVAVQPYAPAQILVNLSIPGGQPQANLQPTQQPIVPEAQTPVAPQPLDVSSDSEIEFKEAQDRALQEKETAKAQVVPEVSAWEGIKDFFTGGLRETEETEDLPEVMDPGGLNVGSFGDNLKIAGGLLIAVDEKDQMDIIKKHAPEVKFNADKKGNVIGDYKGQRFVLNKPGFSFADAQRTVAQMAAFFPAAKFAQIGRSLWAKAALGGVAAAETETGIQQATTELGGEQGLSPERIALAGGLGAGAELLSGGVHALREAKRASKVGAARSELADIAPQVETAKKLTKETGIPLYQAQQTKIPSQLEKQSFLMTLPASSRKASESLRKQNKAAADAVDDFISKIAPDEAVVTGKEKFRTAAQRAVEGQKNIRKEKTSKLYKDAFSENTVVDVSKINKTINDAMADFPESGEVSKTLGKIKSLVGGKKANLRKLHNAKLEIDQLLNKFGENSLGNTTKKHVLDVKNSLLGEMDSASPLYKEAREKFAELSPDVTKLQESIIGKVAGLDDIQLETISKKIFNPEYSKGTIKKAKKIIDSVDPDAWNELVRVELSGRLSKMKADITEAGLTAQNIPGQMHRALFGNAKQKAVLYSAVEGDAAKNLKYLEKGLERASLGRVTGSQTALREEVKKELRGGVGQTMRDIFSKPLSTLASVGDDAAFNRRVRGMAEVMFNPRWRPQMAKIRKINPNSPAAARAMTQLLNRVDKTMDKKEQ